MDETPTNRPMSADRRRSFEPLLDWMADRILEELLAEAAAENPPIDRPPVEPAPAVTGDAHQVQPETGLSRLQAEKARKQRQADELAKEIGEAWALNQATYDELELAAGLHPSRLGRTPTAADLEALGKRLVESPAPLSVLPSSSPAAVASFIEGLHDVFLKI